MQKVADISQFEASAQGAGQPSLSVFNPVENFDKVVPADPTPRQDNNPQRVSVTTRSLDARVTRLEKDMADVKQNMATKQEMNQRFAEINQKFVEVNHKLDKLVR